MLYTNSAFVGSDDGCLDGIFVVGLDVVGELDTGAIVVGGDGTGIRVVGDPVVGFPVVANACTQSATLI